MLRSATSAQNKTFWVHSEGIGSGERRWRHEDTCALYLSVLTYLEGDSTKFCEGNAGVG